jgi:hypothetical protein
VENARAGSAALPSDAIAVIDAVFDAHVPGLA